MMILSSEQLNDIEKYATVFFSPREIAILLKLDVDEFLFELTDLNSEISLTYTRGKLLSEFKLREQIIKLANMGSPAAQIEAMKLINKQKISEIIK